MAIPRPPKALLEKASTTPKALLEKGKHELIFFRDLGFSESFFEVAEDANGAWHNDDLLEFDLNAEQLQVLDELVFAVAMLGHHSVMSVDNEGREAEQSRISEGMVQSLHEVTAKSPNGSRTTGFKLRPGSIDPFRVPDASGAYPMHALFIANSDAALDLGMRILAQRHDLITQVHDPGKFTNENVLHILAANRQHEAFANLVALASRVLDDAGLQRLLLTQADGSFFLEPPMCDFGGSPVGFACYFGGIAAIRALLNNRRTRDLVDLNSSTLLCRRSGFLPIHAAVAAGDAKMYDFLLSLPGIEGRRERVANPTFKTRPRNPHAHKLTALQLAFWRGDAAMVQYCIEQRSRFQWRWGPLSATMFSLAEIDSSGAGGNDLMELIVMNDASQTTREMILDSFLDGMLHKLFRDKWRRFARAQHWMLRALDVVFLALSIRQGLTLKASPATCDRHTLPLLLILLSVLMATFEIFAIVEWIRGRRFSHSSWRAIGWRLKRWMGDLHLYRRLAGIGFVFASTLFTLLSRDHHGLGAGADGDDGVSPAGTAEGAPSGALPPHSPHPADGAGDEIAWACLSIGIYLHFSFFIHVLSVPYARLGIFTLVVERLLLTDVPTFLTFFLLYLLNFAIALYLSYPRAGTLSLPFVDDFNDPIRAAKRMFEMGFMGKTFQISLPQLETAAATGPLLDDGGGALGGANAPGGSSDSVEPLMSVGQLSPSRQLLFTLFCCFYFLCLIFISILLLRLFMATLAATFNSTRMAAQLEWRLQFARHVFRAELMHPNCFGTTFCGDEVDGKHMYIKITRSIHAPLQHVGPEAGELAAKRVAANDLDGGVATTEVVENDLDGDGFPDDPGYEVTAQAGLKRDDDSGSFSFKKGI